MRSNDDALVMRCTACGADVRPMLDRGVVDCRRCGVRGPVEPELLARLRTHEATLAAYQVDVESAATERDQSERERARLGMPLVLRMFFPLLAGMWTIVSLGAGGVAMFAVMPRAQRWLGDEPGGLLGSLAFIGVYASFLVSMRALLLVRKRRLAIALPRAIVREVCPSCGASVPVALDMVAPCPFCRAQLLTSERDRQRIEDSARAAVMTEQRRASDATERAEDSGAKAAAAALEMISAVTLAPLVLIALPVVFARLALYATGDLFSRDQRDIAGIVLMALFIVVAIALAVVITRSRARRIEP